MKKLAATMAALMVIMAIAGCYGPSQSKLNRGNTQVSKNIIEKLDKYIRGEMNEVDAVLMLGEELPKLAPEQTDEYDEFVDKFTQILDAIKNDNLNDVTRLRNEAAAMVGAETI